MARQPGLQPGPFSFGKQLESSAGKPAGNIPQQQPSVPLTKDSRSSQFSGPSRRRGRPKKDHTLDRPSPVTVTEPLNGDKKRRIREAERPLVFRQSFNSSAEAPQVLVEEILKAHPGPSSSELMQQDVDPASN